MKNKDSINALVIILFFFCCQLIACKSNSSPSKNKQEAAAIGEIKVEKKALRVGSGFDSKQLEKNNLKLPPTFYKRLEGTIGKDLNVTVHLMKVGKMFLGNYHYDKFGKALKFDAESGIDEQQNIILREYFLNKNGLPTVTGIFKGKMLTASTLQGEWMSPDSSSLAFVLNESYHPQSAALKVEKLEKNLGNCDIEDCLTISLIYPKIESLGQLNDEKEEENDLLKKVEQVNQQIESKIAEQLFQPKKSKLHYLPLSKVVDTLVFFQQKAAEKREGIVTEKHRWEHEVKTNILANANNILSLGMSFYSYTGGEDAISAYKCLNIDLASGKVIRLDNLLTNNYLRPLTSAALGALKADEGLGEEEKLEDNDFLVADHEFNLSNNFTLSKGGITFFYQPYKLVERPTVLEVFVPFEELEEWLKKDDNLQDFML